MANAYQILLRVFTRKTTLTYTEGSSCLIQHGISLYQFKLAHATICNQQIFSYVVALRTPTDSLCFLPPSPPPPPPPLPSVKVTPDGMESLVTLAEGDMRRALNVLQSTAMAHDEVNEDSVYSCTGQPLPNDVAKIVEWMLNEDFTTAYQSEDIVSFGGFSYPDGLGLNRLDHIMLLWNFHRHVGKTVLSFVEKLCSSHRFILYQH